MRLRTRLVIAGFSTLLLFAQQRRLTVAETPTNARTPKGEFISWKEHRIDDEGVNGGLAIRGGDGVQAADLDKDGYLDIVSVHEDSNHVRIAYGTANPDKWVLETLAAGDEAGGAEDASIGDLNRDGWLDVIVACEQQHLLYLQNPGKRGVPWKRAIPVNTTGRGSWIRVFFADLNGDGKLEVVAPNKGDQTGDPRVDHPPKAISWFSVPADPLQADKWEEHVLGKFVLPINSQPIDLDGDGDLDILAGSRKLGKSWWYENNKGKFIQREFNFSNRSVAQQGGERRLTAFMAAAQDLNADGKVDLVMAESPTTLAWLEQAANFEMRVHPIGGIGPDAPTGISLADLDGDGDLDVVTGGYSAGPRLEDGPQMTPKHALGRLAWFANPGDLSKPWVRHDINRPKRGMFDGFAIYDVDRDGDLDIVGTRGNTGNFDGVFWLEQLRTPNPQRAFQPARASESQPMPLP